MWINMVDGTEVEVLLLFLRLLQMICLCDCVSECMHASMRVPLHACVYTLRSQCQFWQYTHIGTGTWHTNAVILDREQYAVNDIRVDVNVDVDGVRVCMWYVCVCLCVCMSAIVNSSTYVTCHVCAIHNMQCLIATHPLHSQTMFVFRIRNVYHRQYAFYQIGIAIQLNETNLLENDRKEKWRSQT